MLAKLSERVERMESQFEMRIGTFKIVLRYSEELTNMCSSSHNTHIYSERKKECVFVCIYVFL